MIHEDGVAAVRGLGALRARRCATRACRARSSRRARNCPRRARGGRHRRPVRRTSSTASSPSASTCTASRRRTRYLAGARALGVEPAAGGRVRGRARGRAGRPRRRLRLRRRRRPRRPGGGAARARRRRRRRRPRRAAATRRDPPSGVPRRAVGAARDRARPRRPRPDRVACSRSPTATSGCAATSTRASRSACPGTYLDRLLRAAPAAVRRGRLRLPRVAARRSSTSPTASSSACSSTTSRSTCATASCAATSACSTSAPACSTASVEWVSPAGRARARRIDAAGVVHAARGRRRSLYEVEPVDGAVAVVVQSELVANEPLPDRRRATRAPRRRSTRRCAPSSVDGGRPRAILVHSTEASGLRDGRRRWTT